MTAIITKNIRIDAQKAYYDALRNGSEPTYFFFGKSSPWNEEDQIDTSITDNTVLELTKGSDIILAKRLNANDIMPCAKRVDWKQGEVYNQYDMELNMNYVEKHYVLTDEFNVYKCLSNNNGGPSLEKPTGTGFIPFETTDGYKWKFLYTISIRDAKTFLTSKLMPCSFYPGAITTQYKTQAAAIPGTIDSFKIIDSGKGYTIASIEIIGDGTDAKCVPVLSGGRIVSVKVVNRGKNYTWANLVIKGNGTGADIKPQVSPLYGHGYNIPKEICASYLMMAAQVGNEDNQDQWNNLPKSFAFRKIGIIKNITRNDTTNVVDELVNFCYKLKIESSIGLETGQNITFNNGATATITALSQQNDDTFLYLTELDKSVNTDELSSFTVTGTSTSKIIESVEFSPELNYHTIQLLYLETLPEFIRNEENVDLIRFAIEF